MKFKPFFITFFILFIVSFLITVITNFSFSNFSNILFGISLFVFFITSFKYLRDRGVYDIIGYSWEKSKRHILFFLPEYRIEQAEDKQEIKTFDEYVKYRKSKNWSFSKQLMIAAFVTVIISIVLSILSY